MNKVSKDTKVTFLEWDSSFFNKKIGRVNTYEFNYLEISEVLLNCKKNGYSLIYLFSDKKYNDSELLFKNFTCGYIDTKIEYEKKIINNSIDYQCRKINQTDNFNALHALALESGKYSRFKLDTGFNPLDFERFYKIWIDNSVNKIISDDVIVYELNGEIKGFATIKYQGNFAKIGLIAVSPLNQNQGIGKSLMNYVENCALSNNCSILRVATQKINEQACRFYEKQNMNVFKENIIYHIWM